MHKLARLDVCVVDPDPTLYNTLVPAFRAAAAQLRRFDSAEALLETCPSVDCLIAMALLPGITGVEMIRCLRLGQNTVPVILLVPPDDVATAVLAMRSGALDVLETPAHVARLLHSVVASRWHAPTSRRVAAPLGIHCA